MLTNKILHKEILDTILYKNRSRLTFEGFIISYMNIDEKEGGNHT